MKNLLMLLPFFALLICVTACNDDDGPQIELPESIQNYLDTNYPDAEIEESELETLCTGEEVYEVELEVNDDEEIDLTFNNEGALLFTETEIDNSELPADVTASINATYGDYSLEEAERLDMADGSNRYEVELKSSSGTLEVLFESDGTVVCEQEDDDD